MVWQMECGMAQLASGSVLEVLHLDCYVASNCWLSAATLIPSHHFEDTTPSFPSSSEHAAMALEADHTCCNVIEQKGLGIKREV